MKPFCVSICLVAWIVSVNAEVRFFGGPLTGSFTVLPLGIGGSNRAKLNLEGSGFRVVAAEADGGAVDALFVCTPCRPGDEVSLSAVFANDDLGEGNATVAEERLRPAFVAGNLSLIAGTVVIPHGGRSSLTLRAAFVLEDGAELQLYDDDFKRNTREPDQMWGHGMISASGIATINLTRVDTADGFGYLVERMKYVFSTPTIEGAPVQSGVTLLGKPGDSFTATGR